MSLQRRLVLILVLSAVPLVLGLAWLRGEMAKRADVDALRDVLLNRVAVIGRERCEAEPALFFEPRFPGAGPGAGIGPGRRPIDRPGDRPGFRQGGPFGSRGGRPARAVGFRGLEVFLYDHQFAPAGSFAPTFPAELKSALAGAERFASRRTRVDPLLDLDEPDAPALEILDVALRTEWNEGPCAIVLARRVAPALPLVSVGQATASIPLVIGLIAAVWVASGPLVRRVRALTNAVKRASEAGYAVPVPERGRDEITDLARAFNEAGTRIRAQLTSLEQRDRTLREFLANTTHDVMIPLTVLQGHLSQLQRDAAAGGVAPESSLVGAVQEAQYMASLLSNLSAVAKLENPDQLVQRHPVDLNALVERVVERHRPVATPSGVTIEFAVPEVPITVVGDVTLIEQAVSNVVHNAVRYNHPGGHVAVVLDASGHGQQGFTLRVADDGPGVAPEALPRLAERRYRDEHARQRNPHGLGLGLSIARQVAERHGFAFDIRASESGGLEVVFSARA
ncbi:MAG: sensor histidine kinase [Vicinamibacterales bacterium]